MIEDTILITGAAGLLGSSVVREMLNQGAKRIIASDIVAGSPGLHPNVVNERCDISSFESVLRVFEKHRPDVVFHLGGIMSMGCDSAPQTGIQANAIGTYHVLEAARLLGVRQVIFASSTGVMTPSSAEQNAIDDYCCTRPSTVYGAAKLFSENLGLTYKRLHGVDFRTLRLPAVIGPGARSAGYIQWFNKTIEESLHGRPYSIYVAPRTQMDIIHVKDAARAFLQLAQAPLEQIKTVNYAVIGPSPRPSAQELVDLVKAKIPGARISFAIDEGVQKIMDQVLRLPVDDHYARREWGWQHTFDLEAIVSDFMAEMNGRGQDHGA